MIGNIAVATMLAIGLFFLVVAAIGFIRLPDVFCRLHVTGVIDTLGAPLVLLAAAVFVGPTLVAGKLILGIAFIALTSPLVGHLLARAALEAGHQPGVIDDVSVVRARYGRRKSTAERDAGAEPGRAKTER